MVSSKEIEEFRQDMLETEYKDVEQEVQHSWKMRTDEVYALDYYSDAIQSVQKQLEAIRDKLGEHGHTFGLCELIML